MVRLSLTLQVSTDHDVTEGAVEQMLRLGNYCSWEMAKRSFLSLQLPCRNGPDKRKCHRTDVDQ